jgi:hypothetical protein
MFRIRWTPSALSDLAAAWMQASDKTAVNDAVRKIDQRLLTDPRHEGESRPGGERILVELPLGVSFDVSPRQPVVYIWRVWLIAKRTK